MIIFEWHMRKLNVIPKEGLETPMWQITFMKKQFEAFPRVV
jgi:hypothetical protein